MGKCRGRIHHDVCKDFIDAAFDGFLDDGDEVIYDDNDMRGDDCLFYKDRSRFVELPFSISEGTKLRCIFEDETGELIISEDCEVVTRVCKDGFYVSSKLYSDGTYSQEGSFCSWDTIGMEYFFTLKEAEIGLKERRNCV